MITLETLQLVNEMITQLVACWTILISRKVISYLHAIDLSKQQALGAD